MTRDLTLLTQVCRALFGEQWQVPLSRAVKVDARTARRWVLGEFSVPYHVWGTLWRLLERKMVADSATYDALREKVTEVEGRKTS